MPTHRTGLLALTFALYAACAQAGDIEKAVDYRQGLMNVYAYNVTAMGAMAKGKTPFDPAAFSHHAGELATAARLDLLAGFPEHSINDESDASDTIWLDWAGFRRKNEALREASARLVEVAGGGDKSAMKAQFGKTARTCKGCHDDFKH